MACPHWVNTHEAWKYALYTLYDTFYALQKFALHAVYDHQMYYTKCGKEMGIIRSVWLWHTIHGVAWKSKVYEVLHSIHTMPKCPQWVNTHEAWMTSDTPWQLLTAIVILQTTLKPRHVFYKLRWNTSHCNGNGAYSAYISRPSPPPSGLPHLWHSYVMIKKVCTSALPLHQETHMVGAK